MRRTCASGFWKASLVSPDVVQKRLKLLDGYLKKLYKIRDAASLDEFLGDSDAQDIVERNLHLAIESVLDIGQHIIASSGWKSPEEYADIFTILQQNDVISKALLSRMAGMAGFRNLLVHEYAEIDHRQVFDILQNHLQDLSDLAHAYQKFLDAEKR